MALRQCRDHQRKVPRGYYLAFLALAVQVVLPFIVAMQIARMGDPAYADTAVICSALGPSAQHEGNTTDNHHSSGDACPLCTALAVGHAFTTPPALYVPLPQACGAAALSVAETRSLLLLPSSPYQSRGPPSLV